MATEVALTEPALPEARKARRDRRGLWRGLRRLGAWGCGAVLGLGALAITSQTQSGSERIQSVIASVISQTQGSNELIQFIIALVPQPTRDVAVADVPPRVAGINPDSLRLEAQLRVLTADRDRLMARIANLERNLDDMTGSIKKQAALAAEPPAAKSPAPVPAPVAAQTPAPLPIIVPLAMPASTGTTASWSSGNATAQGATPLPEPVPLPPVRLAVAPASEPEPPRKAEIGVDLGGAQNIEVLSARWMAVKANFGPLLTGLHPLAAHDPRPGVTNFRLVVGPLPTNAAAAELCTRFTAARVTCRPAKFDGERIAQR